jgi:hypothetical protein
LNQFSNLRRSKASNGLRILPIAGLGSDGKCHRLSAFNSTILKSNQISQHNFYAALRLAVPFFLRSAHLFLIMSDNRFLPSAVICRPFLAFRMIKVGAALFSERVLAPSVPSSAAMARLRRSLSLFNSDTIAPMSTIPPLIQSLSWIEFPPTGRSIIS